MAKAKVLVELERGLHKEGFQAFSAAVSSESNAYEQCAYALESTAGLGVEPDENLAPVPMFGTRSGENGYDMPSDLAAFADPNTNDDLPGASLVIPVEVDHSNLDALRERDGVVGVWPNSRLFLYGDEEPGIEEIEVQTFDLARSRSGVDCRPFRPAVDISVIRQLLGVSPLWRDGFRGQNVAVGIIDEGINGDAYPVSGGFARIGSSRQPGSAPITSHGSMCAADVLVAAPAARLYDYPFLGVPNSGGALAMFQAVLDQRRIDGTPHLTTNSYGYTGVPDRNDQPFHEVHDLDHPLHRKVREVVASGAAAFFAAGNCGEPCPTGRCHPSGIGPGLSIHASNSLREVITVAAVNSRHERIGYSSQGPGMFEKEKPDLAAYTHFFGNFGPGRPGGTSASPFDSGTSAATPIAAGAAALLLSAFPELSPGDLRKALLAGLVSTTGSPWDPGYGQGILNVAASYWNLLHKP
ncbi:S8 family serine peptidase [Streptomyces sp. NPDC050636]|uniref:S8 family serine peptidase n=1 Tax=Streptomyces sp. NPDC050636 TaxID=3154510 RepID=UPI00342F4E6D